MNPQIRNEAKLDERRDCAAVAGARAQAVPTGQSGNPAGRRRPKQSDARRGEFARWRSRGVNARSRRGGARGRDAIARGRRQRRNRRTVGADRVASDECSHEVARENLLQVTAGDAEAIDDCDP
jgi:hypothetical protein